MRSASAASLPDSTGLFAAFADETRLRLLSLLCVRELCVCDLCEVLDEIQPKISRHLAQLRESGMVLDRRQGQWIFYRLNPALPDWAREVLAATRKGLQAQAPFRGDLQALAKMRQRPEGVCCA